MCCNSFVALFLLMSRTGDLTFGSELSNRNKELTLYLDLTVVRLSALEPQLFRDIQVFPL